MKNSDLPELCELLKRIEARGWCDATGGNYSIRTNAGEILITRSGIFKGEAQPEDFITVDSEGIPIKEGVKSSDETALHTLIYRNCSEAKVVLHTHSPEGTALSLSHRFENEIRFQGMEMQKALPNCSSHKTTISLPLFENMQDVEELANNIEESWENISLHNGFYLVGHGLYTWGNSIAQARRHLEGWEFLIKATCVSHSIQGTSLK